MAAPYGAVLKVNSLPVMKHMEAVKAGILLEFEKDDDLIEKRL